MYPMASNHVYAGDPIEHSWWLSIPTILTVLSEHVVIQQTSLPAILPFASLSTNNELVLYLCSDTLYVMCVLHCMYLIPSIVTVALLVDVGLPF